MDSQTSITTPDGELIISRDLIRVDYLSDLDRNWEFTDAAGHQHHCDYDAADHYPTLRDVTDGAYWCGDCREEHGDSHWECRLCGEHIQPGLTGPGTIYRPGMISATFNGHPVSMEQASQILARYKQEMENRG
jgi:hypothetical protein